jgi:hypothetical protein
MFAGSRLTAQGCEKLQQAKEPTVVASQFR